MKPLLRFICTLPLLAACTAAPQADRTDTSRVTILFDDCPDQLSTRRFGSSMRSLPETTVDFVDTLLRLRHYTPPQAGRDTLTIPAWGGYAEIVHRNQCIEDNCYLIEGGDTVLFTYAATGRPQLRSLRSERNTWLYNLPEEDPRAIHRPTGYNLRTVCTYSKYRLMWWVLNGPKRKSAPRELLERYERCCPDLDSLQPILEAYEADFAARIDSLERAKALPPRYADHLRRCRMPHAGRDDSALGCDSLLHYPSVQRLALSSAWAIPPREVTAARCTQLAADTAQRPLARAAALRYMLERLASNDGGWHRFAPELLDTCNRLYVALTGDRSYTPEVIVGKPHLENGYTVDLVVEAADGTRHDLADILHRLRGKVVYTDLWASWCGPCCGEMPAALKLREEYAGREAAFVYLSLDEGREAWLRAADRHAVERAGGLSYRVLNAAQSRFMKEIGHRRIPHLLLFDRQGRLADDDAPRPGEAAARTAIDCLLAAESRTGRVH